MAPDLGWLQQYVKVGFFTDLRRQARQFYEQNETTYAFLWLNSIAYGNMDFVREACPEAARLALLLRAEERLPAREAEPPLLEFAALAGAAAWWPRSGRPEPSAGTERARASAWPLAEGLERLRRLTARMAVPDEYSVDVVMPYCDEPLDGLLSRATGYDDDWLSTRVPLRQAGLVLYRLEVCMSLGAKHGGTGDAALAQLPQRAAIAAALFRSVEIVPVDASPHAWEAARYLRHLADRYHRLADFTLFLHPDVFEHVNPRTLRNVLQALRVGTLSQSGLGPERERGEQWFEYLSLSHHYLKRPSRVLNPSSNCTDAELGFRDLWRNVLGTDGVVLEDSDPSDPGDFGFYCCSQFMVHRDRVRRRSQEWYKRVAEGIAWEHCATSYMELLWHGIFNGGNLHEEKRQHRNDLPLFLRVDNFVEATSDGLV